MNLNSSILYYMENKFQIPPFPPLLKGGEGGLSIFHGSCLSAVVRDFGFRGLIWQKRLV